MPPDTSSSREAAEIEWWGGPECTINRVGERYFDQVRRSGHHARIEDIDTWAALKLAAVRYPVLWEQIAPESPDRPDWRWTDGRLARIRSLGVRPIAGLLHHGSGPRYTSLLDRAFPEQLARFAGQVAERYPWVTDYTPVNEPLTTARFSTLYGHWYPHHRDDRSFVRALLNQTWGVIKAMQAIRAVNPAARLVQTEDCGRCYGTSDVQTQVTFENHRRWLTWDLLTGGVTSQHPLWAYLVESGADPAELDSLADQQTPPQVIGVNYYLTSDRFLDHRLVRYPRETHGTNGRIAYADVAAVRARPEGIAGHEHHLREAWLRYRLPVALTEVHLACTREEQMRWLWEAWRGAQKARAGGAAVMAITPWALLGAYDWNSLVTEPHNHYESGAYDVRSPEPRPTALARMIGRLAAGGPPHAATATQLGWWRRPERLIHGSAPSPVRFRRHARPLLILGRSGTLGRAFREVGEQRGLYVASTNRTGLDITDEAAVRRVLHEIRPWGVVNATGYVHVDDAEQDRETCYQVNVIGAVNVAQACRSMNLPLVSYSSDLVFDGLQRRDYTEADEPRPLNVYGASKAEAERQLLTMPRVLLIRTSALFGPWDSSNFVVRMLASIQHGHPSPAAAEIVISPTYVPDLVHTTLDLLLDGETGLWHLTNAGATSWFHFAQAAAAACGMSPDLVEPAKTVDLGWRAPRPAYSALTSGRGQLMRSTGEALIDFARIAGWRSRACA